MCLQVAHAVLCGLGQYSWKCRLKCVWQAGSTGLSQCADGWMPVREQMKAGAGGKGVSSELRLSRVTRLVPSWGVFSVGQVALVSQDSEQGSSSAPTLERMRFQASCGDSPRSCRKEAGGPGLEQTTHLQTLTRQPHAHRCSCVHTLLPLTPFSQVLHLRTAVQTPVCFQHNNDTYPTGTSMCKTHVCKLGHPSLSL